MTHLLDALWLGMKGAFIFLGFYLALAVIALPILAGIWVWDHWPRRR